MQYEAILRIPENHPPKCMCTGLKRLHIGSLGGYYSIDLKDPTNNVMKRLKVEDGGQEFMVECIRHDDGFNYILMHSARGWTFGKVEVCNKDEEDHVMKTWKHNDKAHETNQFAMYNGIIYAPSRSEECVFRYDLDGNPIGEAIKINLGDIPTFACIMASGLLILCQTNPSLLVGINTEMGTAVWFRKDLVHPCCMTYDAMTDEFLLCTKTADAGEAVITVFRGLYGIDFNISGAA